MAYLGKGRREDLFVLATELNLKFDKSMTIATLKDLIISSENYDEELTKNIHSTIVEDRKAREEYLRIEEQKEKLRIEEQKEKLRIEEREERLRFEQLRKVSTTICHSPKASERTWIDFYHELNTYFNGWIDGLKIDTFNKLSDLIITDQLKRKTPFEFKEYYLDEWANMNSAVQLAEKLEEFEDFKRTLKQKSSSPFVKKQEIRFKEKNRRYEAPRKFEYNRKDKKFPASTNYNKHYEAPVTNVKRYQDSAQKGYYNKNYEEHANHNASKHAQTNYPKSQKLEEPPKETCTLIVKEGLRTKEIFFGKVKITALIDSGSTVSLLRENTSRRIMDPTKLSKNKMLLTCIGEAQVTTIGSFEHKFKIDDENYSLTWHVVPTGKLKFEAVIGSDLLEQASISFTKEGVKFNKYENHAQLMQISAENLQEELDLRHVENR
ncbi:uncharacterized protein TNCV_2362711 [Trichonephila clavipes]|nr:uncharacterized protein TNCV_2362711 [Trichonephila clavipes]